MFNQKKASNLRDMKITRNYWASPLLAGFVFFTLASTFVSAQDNKVHDANPKATSEQNADSESVVDLTELTHPLQPALWKVEGNGLETHSYLFGTVHHGDPRLTALHPDAEKAFKESSRFYGELPNDPAQKMAAALQLMRRDGKALSESLGPELTKQARDAILAINPKYNVNQLQIFKTWAAAMLIPSVSKPGEYTMPAGTKTLDQVLYEQAAKARKRLGALESPDSQAAVMDQFTEEEQIQLVEAAVKMLKKKKEKEKEAEPDRRVHELYIANDLARLANNTNKQAEEGYYGNEELSKRLTKALKGDRNVKMADKIEAFLNKSPDETHFFAVGVGHYTGKDSVNEYLTKKGYTITPLFTPLDPKTVIKGYGERPKMEIADAPKKPAKEIKIGKTISEIRWGKHLAGPKIQKTDKLKGKVVLLVLWGS